MPGKHFLIACLFLGIGISACQPLPSRTDSAFRNTPLAQAQRYEQHNNFQQAADLYLLTALKVTPPDSERWRSKAAEMAWRAGNFNQADRIIHTVDEAQLEPAEKARMRLVAARIARFKRAWPEVVRLLDFPREGLPDTMRKEMLSLLDEAQQKTGEKRSHAALLIERFGKSGITSNSDRLWDELMSLRSQDLSRWLSEASNPVERGWVELAYIAKTSAYSSEGLDNALLRWEQSYSDHPAWPERITTLRTRQASPAIPTQPGRIAVLLPTSGPFAWLAEVILDGIMAAKYGHGGDYETSVQIYNTAGSGVDIHQLYQQAASEGAELILGPIQKELVDALAANPLSVPVLTLNYGKDLTLFNPNLYQFALLPEDEARQTAERILRDGFTRVGVLAPETDWGNRVAEAFGQHLQAQGGSVVAAGRYNPKNKDYSRTIKQTLKGSGSQAGAEAIFIAASPAQARLIRPLLKFHYLGSVPVYATSHVYSGQPDRQADRDLNGITYTEIPWLLGASDGSSTSGAPPPRPPELDELSRHHPRMFAFGYDSFNLAPQLQQLSASPAESYSGLSGQIYIDEQNRVHRTMEWAKFRGGRPDALPATAALPMSEGSLQ